MERDILKNIMEVNSVEKSYGMERIIDRCSFAIREGEIYGLLGINGAGKTTLMTALALACFSIFSAAVVAKVTVNAYCGKCIGFIQQPDRSKGHVWDKVSDRQRYYNGFRRWSDRRGIRMEKRSVIATVTCALLIVCALTNCITFCRTV